MLCSATAFAGRHGQLISAVLRGARLCPCRPRVGAPAPRLAPRRVPQGGAAALAAAALGLGS